MRSACKQLACSWLQAFIRTPFYATQKHRCFTLVTAFTDAGGDRKRRKRGARVEHQAPCCHLPPKAMKLPNAYTAALTDYMRKPRLKEVNHYGGTTTYTVSKKELEIKQVTVELGDDNGGIKERHTLHPVRDKAVGFKLTDAERRRE